MRVAIPTTVVGQTTTVGPFPTAVAVLRRPLPRWIRRSSFLGTTVATAEHLRLLSRTTLRA
jgi:hypothetical protein